MIHSKLKSIAKIFLIFLILSCGSQSNKIQQENEPVSISESSSTESEQIDEYVGGTFEDTKGNLWIGTLEKGVAKYDGKKLIYLTTKNGLPSNRVTAVDEDKNGNMWFGTGEGLSKYDGKSFTNFTMENGLCNNSLSTFLIDSRGDFWIGTWGGVCKFDGKTFSEFKLPTPKVNTQINPDTENWITEIMEDSKGNIWIGRDGYGACKYDGKSFVHYLKSDGLYSNYIHGIVEDKEGNFWFASRVAERDNPDPNTRTGEGGITKYDGKKYTHFPEIEGLNKADVYCIYRDETDILWISTIKDGLYKYDGLTFTNYKVPKPITNILKDKKGTVWLGCAGGFYRLAGNEAVNVTVDGPWE